MAEEVNILIETPIAAVRGPIPSFYHIHYDAGAH